MAGCGHQHSSEEDAERRRDRARAAVGIMDALSLRCAGGTSSDDAIMVLDDDDDGGNNSNTSRNSSNICTNNNNKAGGDITMIDNDCDEEGAKEGGPSRRSQLAGDDSDVGMTTRKRPLDRRLAMGDDDVDHDRVFRADLCGVSTGWSSVATEGSSSRTNDQIVCDDYAVATRIHRRQQLDRMGCRFHPSRSPIKLFATKQDEELRQRLHLVAGGGSGDRQSSSSSHGTADGPQHPQEREQQHWSFNHCWTFREMLGLDRMWGAINGGGIDFVVIGTYILDVDFLIAEVPELMDVPLVVVVYQHRDPSVTGAERAWKDHVSRRRRNGKNATLVLLERNPRADPKSASNPLGVRMDYGCHHAKFILVGYTSGRLRIIIHTSNLRREDVHLKCQGAYIQDFCPKTEDQLDSFATSDFEEALVQYMESYRYLDTHIWTSPSSSHHQHQRSLSFSATSTGGGTTAPTTTEATTLVAHLQTYDFSTAVVVLIPSIPGYHSSMWQKRRDGHCHQGSPVFGYLKVQQAIAEYGITTASGNFRNSYGSATGSGWIDETTSDIHLGNRKPTIVCQFSSIGSLSKPYLDKLATAWCVDSVAVVAVPASKTYNNSSSRNPYLPPQTKRPKTIVAGSNRPTHQNLKIVWPTVHEIATSVEGPMGGQTVPGRTNCVGKEFLQPLYHKWDGGCHTSAADRDGLHYQKGRNVPHIKTYYEIDNDNDEEDCMKWFVLTSHNLSKGMGC
jgi:hypothetical protein